jgi:uncharacterized membrane protein YhaH (DUF805 family)
MWGSIKYNFAHLLDFKGRDARQTFWYFVLFVYVLNTALTIMIAIPAYVEMMSRIFAMSASNPDPEAMQQIMPSMMGELADPMMEASVISAVVFIVLLSAAFTRRLHDSGLRGWWGLIPLAFYVFSILQMPKVFGALKEMPAPSPEHPFAQIQSMQQEMGINSLIGWIPMIIVIALGVRKSTDGPNEFGEEPVQF